MNFQNVVLTIAGSDSIAGAGIQADMKSVTACGAYCTTAITALTAQNTVGVRGVSISSDNIVRGQIEAVAEDLTVDAIKLGMLPSVGIVEIVRESIVHFGVRNIVLDPVMIATSGDMLVANEVVSDIVEKLLPLTTIITPNIPETEFITGIKINYESDFGKAAHWFKDRGAKALLLKSGHLTNGEIADHLFIFESEEHYIFRFKRIDTLNTHGTGCSLSSSIAAYLAQGYSLHKAVEAAEKYIHHAIKSATYKMGYGHGSINHFHNFSKKSDENI